MPVDAYNLNEIALSPLNDLSPLSFFYENGSDTIGTNTMSCPISAGDSLVFTLKNPQSGDSITTVPVSVQ